MLKFQRSLMKDPLGQIWYTVIVNVIKECSYKGKFAQIFSRTCNFNQAAGKNRDEITFDIF